MSFAKKSLFLSTQQMLQQKLLYAAVCVCLKYVYAFAMTPWVCGRHIARPLYVLFCFQGCIYLLFEMYRVWQL